MSKNFRNRFETRIKHKSNIFCARINVWLQKYAKSLERKSIKAE